jgi:hypothetical protein
VSTSNGTIYSSNGTYRWDFKKGAYTEDNTQNPWQVGYPTPGTYPHNPAPQKPFNPNDFSKLLQNQQPVGATGDFCDFASQEIVKQLDKIMECDTVYLRSNTPKGDEPMPKGSLKVQIHEYPNDWDNSLTIYESNGETIDDLRHINGLVALLAMMITMGGRDVVLNEKDYTPGNDY